LFGSSRESNQLSRAFPGGDLDVKSFYIKCNIRTNNIFNFFSLLLQSHHAVRIPLDITQDKERNYCTVKQTIGNYHTLVVSLEDYWQTDKTTRGKERNYYTVKQTINNYHTLGVSLEYQYKLEPGCPLISILVPLSQTTENLPGWRKSSVPTREELEWWRRASGPRKRITWSGTTSRSMALAVAGRNCLTL
jgi:hypothetical protein